MNRLAEQLINDFLPATATTDDSYAQALRIRRPSQGGACKSAVVAEKGHKTARGVGAQNQAPRLIPHVP